VTEATNELIAWVLMPTGSEPTGAWVLWDLVVHNWALTAICLTLAILLITPALIVRKYVTISLNILKDTPPPLSRGPRDFIPLDGEDVEFRSFDQSRQWASDREVNDMIGAIAYVEDRLEARGHPVKLGIFGISRGAGAAILAAQNDPRVHALLVDGAFSTDTTIEHLMRRWAYIFAKVRFVYENHPPVFWRFLRWCMFQRAQRELGIEFPSVRKALMRMKPRPIFFIHGQKDNYIPVEQTELLYALAGQPKYKWIVAGAKHNQPVIIQPEQYAARTVAFFDRYLADLPPTDAFFADSVVAELAQPLAEPARSSHKHPTMADVASPAAKHG
jgi:fermentation-respiration switch protein FrsA (DUF1100 family)